MDIQAELFETCKALTPTGYGLSVQRTPITPLSEFMWDVVVFEKDQDSGYEPGYISQFTVEGRQFGKLTKEEKDFFLTVRMDDCVANIQNARAGLLD